MSEEKKRVATLSLLRRKAFNAKTLSCPLYIASAHISWHGSSNRAAWDGNVGTEGTSTRTTARDRGLPSTVRASWYHIGVTVLLPVQLYLVVL